MLVRRPIRFTASAIAAALLVGLTAGIADATNAPQGLPFAQNWTNPDVLTVNDDWTAVPGIEGFLGQDLTTGVGVDPQTLLGVSAAANDLDVIANQTNTAITNGGVAEFQTPDPTIALQGSGTADAPNIVLTVTTTGATSLKVAYKVRDLDASADNAVQAVALQYRIGTSGPFVNVPAAFIADATTGPALADVVTPVSVSLPDEVANQAAVQVRVITANATGSDEWVGIDDLEVTGVITEPSSTSSSLAPSSTTLPGNTSTTTTLAAGGCGAAITPIFTIQGAGAATSITAPVTTRGVVIGDYEVPAGATAANFLRGFYIQDLEGDGNAATSDGLFVFNANADSVSLGDIVQVTGTPAEFQNQTQLATVTSLVKCGTGSVLPTDIALPFASATASEAFEGMLVRAPQALTVTETFQLGRFGQVTVSSGGRLRQPTNVTSPGAAAAALQAQNDLNRLVIDDSSQGQNPDPIVFGRGGNPLSASNTLRGGDTITGAVGVLTYGFGGNAASPNAFRLRPINALNGSAVFTAVNQRPATSEVPGSLRASGLNLLNFFNTFDGLPDTVDNCTNGTGGAAADCRGADTPAEFARQWPKTVAAIDSLQSDVVGVIEIENDGYGPDSAIAFLVERLNAASGPNTYAYVDVDAKTGQANSLGTDAIKVGLLYKPAKVKMVGTTATLNTAAFVNGGDASPRSRASLLQAFEQLDTGATFVVNVNHFKSKGSACDAPDANDGQANCNVVRTNAANQLTSWLATNPTETNDPDVLLLGDFNAYAKEDPITAIRSAGFTNLVEDRLGVDAYSYGFNGQWGYLDYAFASPSMNSQVAGVSEFHINADEPSTLDYNTDFKTPNLISSLYAADQYRVSDHDPVIVGLNLVAPNQPPTAVLAVPATAFAGLPFTVGLASPADPLDPTPSFTYAFDCGSGFGAFGAPATVQCSRTGTGAVNVGAKIRDRDGAETEYRQDIAVTVTYQSLCTLSKAVVVSRPTVSTLLCETLRGAAKAESLGWLRTERFLLTLFRIQVELQRGRSISPENANLLISLSQQL
jgi:uncharacterized protein